MRPDGFSEAHHRISAGLDRRAELWQRLQHDAIREAVEYMAERATRTFLNGGRLLFAGNGGSAADAQHLAAEYIGVGLPALALTTDTSVLTALGNDFGFSEVFGRQLRSLGDPRDLLILHSTSGNSKNVAEAAWVAHEMHLGFVALVAKDGGEMRRLVEDGEWRASQPSVVVVPTDDTALAQEAHLAIGHMVFEAVVAEIRPAVRATA